MSRKRFKLEQIIGMLREAEVGLSQGMKVRDICRGLGISEQTYYLLSLAQGIWWLEGIAS